MPFWINKHSARLCSKQKKKKKDNNKVIMLILMENDVWRAFLTELKARKQEKRKPRN